MPVLPLSIQGSVAFAHNPESSSYSSGDSFFMYRFSSQQAGLGGKGAGLGGQGGAHARTRTRGLLGATTGAQRRGARA